MVADFFNLSSLPWVQRHSHLLQLVDKIYQKIIALGFTADICQARLKALQDPCAFNIFVKANTILTNQHLGFLDTEFETILGAEVIGLGDIHCRSPVPKGRPSFKPHKTSGATKLQERKRDAFEKILVLRALSSEYVFLILEQLLRDSNLRDCRDVGTGRQNLGPRDERRSSKRASILAIVAIMLEQVLDFGDSLDKSGSMDNATKRRTRELSLVLLSYMRPPSLLSFPSEAPVNQTFGLSSDDSRKVFMHNTFWWELYKETADLLPSHLLQVRLENQPDTDRVSLNRPSNGLNSLISRLEVHYPSPRPYNTLSQPHSPTLPGATDLDHQSSTIDTTPGSSVEPSTSRRLKGTTDEKVSQLTKSYMRMNVGVKERSGIDLDSRPDPLGYADYWMLDALEREVLYNSTIIFPYTRYLDDGIEGSLGIAERIRYAIEEDN
jgi:hypothetical protein